MFELNGYQIPDFPESRYPYAMVSLDSSGGCAYLTFTDKVGYIKKVIVDNVWYGNSYTMGLTADATYDESKVIYEESYVVMLDEAYKDALELLYPGINKTSWLRYTPSSKQTPSGGYYSLAMNYGPQWANFTLYDEDGNLFLPAGKKFKLRGWLSWLLAGLCSRPLPMSKREPVAWLYNGVRLPGLPETNYQYAVMFETTEELVYQLYFTIEPPTATDSVLYPVKIEPPYTHYSYNAADTPMWEWQGSGETALEVSVFDYAHWANCDIFDNAGSVFLAASDPVPVYE